MSPQGALAAVGLTLVVSGVALLVRSESRSDATTLWVAGGSRSSQSTTAQEFPTSAARLRRASFALMITGAGLLVAVAVGTFVWWFTVGTHGF